MTHESKPWRSMRDPRRLTRISEDWINRLRNWSKPCKSAPTFPFLSSCQRPTHAASRKIQDAGYHATERLSDVRSAGYVGLSCHAQTLITGTGKTLLARACAAQTKACYLKLAGPSLVQVSWHISQIVRSLISDVYW